jgi:hypothetical protein
VEVRYSLVMEPLPSSTPVIPSNTPTSTATQPAPTFTPTPTIAAPTDPPSPTATMAGGQIFSDGFEAGNLLAWSSSVTDSGDLFVSPEAALTGDYGLHAVIDDTYGIYVADDSPVSESHYHLRFFFDPNSISMANLVPFPLFIGYNASGNMIARLEFRLSSGSYNLQARMRIDTGSWANTNFLVISDNPHLVEMDFQAATVQGANDGVLTFWIDGIQQARLTNLNNDTWRQERITLGVPGGAPAGTWGSYYIDGFESWR